MKINGNSLVLATACFFAAIPVSFAQSDDVAVEEVIVTAQRRAESLQEVPVAITALSERALEDRQIVGLTDVAFQVPNLHISSNIGQGSATTAFLRGVGETDAIITIDAPIGFYLDDVYMGRTGVNNLYLFDVERVEVLRGPQGTLYGRNTSGGAIKVITNQPSFETEGKAEVALGSFDQWRVNGMMNIPLSERTALRTSFVVGDGGGDTRNVLDGSRLNEMEVGGAMAKLRTDFSDTFSLEFAADWLRTNQNGRYAVDIAGILREPTGSIYRASSGEDSKNVGKTWGITANAVWNASEDVTFKSISSFRRTDQRYNLDLTDQPVPVYILYGDNESDQFSQEFQITGSAVDDRMNYVGGLYYFNEQSSAYFDDYLFQSLNFNKDVGVDVDSYAAFAQVDYEVIDNFTLIVGGRWTRDEKSIRFVQRFGGAPGFEPGGVVIFDTDTLDGQVLPSRPDRPVSTDLSFNQFTPKLGVQYTVSDDLNFYATYTEGFKSGGWSARVTAADEFWDFGPEKSKSYELGAKGRLFNRRGQFSLAGFYYDYENLFNTGTTETGSFGIATSNAEIYGVELETNWQFSRGLNGFLTLSYQEGERKSVSAASIQLGEELQRLPNWQFAAGLSGKHSLSPRFDFVYNASYSYMDEHYVNPQNTAPGLVRPIELVNALVGLEAADGKYRFTVGCRNCLGEEYIDQILDFAALGFTTVYAGERSHWTATLTGRF